nr:efflux RND transporter permease subunit [Alphaproteobacteria bacterium]
DDAIVVVENVERNMRQNRLNAHDAALRAMEEVQGPVVAIVFVLCSVFIPVAFLGGIAGELYKQFAITIAVSVVISGFVALSLSPALAAQIIKPREHENRASRMFNGALEWLTEKYLKIASWFLRHTVMGLTIFAAIICGLVWYAKTVPTSFVPDEDQGYVIALANLPDGASLDRNMKVADQIQQIANAHPGVERVIALTGFSLLESLDRTNIGTNFVMLKPWDQRTARGLHADAILADLQREFMAIQDAEVVVVNPPAIQGLGTVGGFEFWIENRGDGGDKALERAVDSFIKEAYEHPVLAGVHTTAQFNNLQFYVDLDRPKARALGVSIGEAYEALQALLGSVYINNFNKYGRVFQVIVQALPEYRERVTDLGDMYVKSTHGQMVPLKSFMSITPRRGPNLVSRFNDFPAAEIIAGPAPGYTSGQGIAAMEEIAEKVLGPDMNYGWSGMAFQQIATGGTSSVVLLAGLIMIFLVLAALYEKWSLPLSILMAVPFGAFGAFTAVFIRGMPNDVYFQIGLVTLIALSAKNAILIVEFAKIKHEEGMGVEEAAIEAAKLRFRAILMTSLTFILGVTPLVISQGAGAASRHSVGTGVLGGMISATVLALCFVPLFFKLFYREHK